MRLVAFKAALDCHETVERHDFTSVSNLAMSSAEAEII